MSENKEIGSFLDSMGVPDTSKNISKAGHDMRNDAVKSGWNLGNRGIKSNSDGGIVNTRDGADIAARFTFDVLSRKNK